MTEVVRGGEAWAMISAANMFNDPPQDGYEYLLVRIWAKSVYADDEAHSIGGGDFKVTGDRLTLYSSAWAVEPDPQLDAELFTGGETEGWAAFLIAENEGQLILVFDEMSNWDGDRYRFIALEAGVSISVSPELARVSATDLGTKRTSPAPYGETVTSEDWQVSVLDVVRGADAWILVQQANQFNDAPDPGMEYVTVRIKARYVGIGEGAADIDAASFKTTGSAGVLYDMPFVVDPEPALDAVLFPGGESEGWVVMQVAEGETGVILVFEPLWDFSSSNNRFLSLEP